MLDATGAWTRSIGETVRKNQERTNQLWRKHLRNTGSSSREHKPARVDSATVDERQHIQVDRTKRFIFVMERIFCTLSID